MTIVVNSGRISDIILNFLALLFISQFADEIMSARIINYQGAMGGKIVPILKVTWTIDDEALSSLRSPLMPLQKFLMLTIVPATHLLIIALVDVNAFVRNETYAGGNMWAFVVGWLSATCCLLLIDYFKPTVLTKVQSCSTTHR